MSKCTAVNQQGMTCVLDAGHHGKHRGLIRNGQRMLDELDAARRVVEAARRHLKHYYPDPAQRPGLMYYDALAEAVEVYDALRGNKLSDRLAAVQPFIAITPGICGGAPRIQGTRISTAIIYALHRRGLERARIAELYPLLSSEEIDAAIAFEEIIRDDD